MFRTMMKSKIHRATVTHADLHYVGSVTVDQDLMDAADLLEGEQVCIVDIDNGARLETYVIAGERGSGVIGINGAAAHLVQPRRPGHPHRLRPDGRAGGAATTSRGGLRRRPQPAGRARQPTRRTHRRAPGLISPRTLSSSDAAALEPGPCCSRSTSATPISCSGCSPAAVNTRSWCGTGGCAPTRG